MRDIKAAYEEALVEEYDSYVRAGRSEDAKEVARVLKEQYGHDVAKRDSDGDDKGKKPEPKPELERADVEKPPEAAVDPKPRRGRPPTKPTVEAQPGPRGDK